MEHVALVFMNPVNDERAEEFNNWYVFVHLFDVLVMKDSAIAAQRFIQSKYQPKGFDPYFKWLTVYEVINKEAFVQGHIDVLSSYKCQISTAIDFGNFRESFWDNVCGNTPYASYAEFKPENNVMTVQICEKDGLKAEEVFAPEVVYELAAMDGIYAANLYSLSEFQMAKKSAAPEIYTHQLVIQFKDARDGIASWEAFVEKYPDITRLDTSICNFVNVMPRLKACDCWWPTMQDRGLFALTHTLTSLPGFSRSSNVEDIVTPAVKQKIDAMQE